ncbi:MAG: hypothetical protein R2792_08465 [Saprospiraceae bacterium]
MRKINTVLLFSAVLLLCIPSCIKDPILVIPPTTDNKDTLPPITHTGANTFGCYVNGELWVAQVPPGSVTIHDIIPYYYESDASGNLIISCYSVDQNRDEWMSIVCKNSNFSTQEFCSIENSVSARYKKSSGERYLSDYFTLDTNCITITYIDTVENIISGLFEFTVYNDTLNPNDKVRITDGRFDVRYFPY